MAFTHLHVHTEFSLLDGFCKIKELPGVVKSMGQTACAITDHGVMYGVIDFYRACKAEGIKPIIGCEVYVAPQGRTRFDKVHEFDSESRHLVLLCENEEGYRNLSYMVSLAWTEGFYIKPRIDQELLREHAGGPDRPVRVSGRGDPPPSAERRIRERQGICPGNGGAVRPGPLLSGIAGPRHPGPDSW